MLWALQPLPLLPMTVQLQDELLLELNLSKLLCFLLRKCKVFNSSLFPLLLWLTGSSELNYLNHSRYIGYYEVDKFTSYSV